MVSLVQLTKLFLNPMLDRREGRILNVASTASFPTRAVPGALFREQGVCLFVLLRAIRRGRGQRRDGYGSLPRWHEKQNSSSAPEWSTPSYLTPRFSSR